MTRPDRRPVILRKGAIVRVPGDPSDWTTAQVYVDLRFDDDHVERWLGPTSGRQQPEQPIDFGHAATEEHVTNLLAEYGMAWGSAPRDAFAMAPVEIVVEWNAGPSPSFVAYSDLQRFEPGPHGGYSPLPATTYQHHACRTLLRRTATRLIPRMARSMRITPTH